MKYKNCFAIFVLSISILMYSINVYGKQAADKKNEYGVFIGPNSENVDKLCDYKTVVVDAAYYSKEAIETLHHNEVKIYSYLNIGSIETFRESYPAYRHLALGEYENWQGEYWVDVSRQEWKKHIVKEAGILAEKGVDGFFLDNIDVYYKYPKPKIFQGLVSIINELKQYKKDVIINGGDVFIAKAILEAKTPLIQITGINQECVFTGIDFESNKFIMQEPDVAKYFQTYLERCKDAGLAVYLTEYDSDSKNSLRKDIDIYCKKHKFTYFISSSIALDDVGA